MAKGWAENLLRSAAGLSPGEQLMVMVDRPLWAAAQMLSHAAQSLTKREPTCRVLPDSDRPFTLISTALAHDAARAEVLIVLCSGAIGQWPQLQAAFAAVQGAGRGRILTAGYVTDSLLSSELCADFAAVDEAVQRLAQSVRGQERIRLETSAGTNLTFSIAGRRWHLDRGIVRAPGDHSNLPGGEVFIAPHESTAEGYLVVDLCIGERALREPIRLTFAEGRVLRIEGGREARLLQERLGTDPMAWTIGEWGIGANPFAQVRGHAAIDEKVAGTMHIALGGNRSFGGDNPAESHLDCVFRAPSTALRSP